MTKIKASIYVGYTDCTWGKLDVELEYPENTSGCNCHECSDRALGIVQGEISRVKALWAEEGGTRKGIFFTKIRSWEIVPDAEAGTEPKTENNDARN